MSPPGSSALYILMPCPNTRAPIDWDAEKPRLRETIIGQLRDRMGVNIEGRIRVETMLTPNDWQGDGIQFGATFNLAHNLGQMLHKRVPNELPDVRGCWFVGGGTHPGSGLPVIYEGARISARLLLKDLGVDTSFLDVEQPPANVEDAAAEQAAQEAVDKVAS